MNSLPVVTISRADGGHQILCSCGMEKHVTTRAAADLWASEHRASHGSSRIPYQRTGRNS